MSEGPSSGGIPVEVAGDRRGARTPLDDPARRRLLEAVRLEPPGVGEQVGPFRLAEAIGSGGSALVFRAVQEEPVRREVAVKVLASGDRGISAVWRFERERQVLVSLRHPGIVQLLEAGVTASGFPWFAMELVSGRTLDRWVRETEPDLRERLRILRDLAEAVAAAHRQGVLHRDLKPANALVQETPSGAVVRVVDFGIAKLLEPGEEPIPRETIAGHVIGTPEYMSPEAASLEPARIDTRSDVYSLGLLAYETLCERRAIETPRGATLATRLQAALAPSIAPLSRAGDTPLGRRLRGEIEWVVRRCLEPDPQRRYASAAEVAEEFGRLLRGEAVVAAPPSVAYQLRVLVRRHRAAAVAGLLLLVAILAGAAVSTAYAIGESRQRGAAEVALEQAEAERGRAEQALAGEASERARAEAALAAEAKRSQELEQVVGFQGRLLSEIDLPAMGRDLRREVLESPLAPAGTAGDGVDRSVEAFESLDFTGIAQRLFERAVLAPSLDVIDAEFSEQPLVQAQLLLVAAEAHLGLGLAEGAARLAARAEEIFAADAGPSAAAVFAARRIRLRAVAGTIDAAEQQAQLTEAWEAAREALGATHPTTLQFLSIMAMSGARDPEAAEWQIEETSAALVAAEAEYGASAFAVMDLMHSLATHLNDRGRFAEAVEIRKDLLTRSREAFGPDHRHALVAQGHLAGLLDVAGRFEEALALQQDLLPRMRRVLGDLHPSHLLARSDHAVLLSRLGRLEEAQALHREVLEARIRAAGPGHLDTLRSMANLGVVLRRLNELEEAVSLQRRAADGGVRILGERHPDSIMWRSNLAASLQSAGRLEESRAELERLLPLAAEVLGPDHPTTLVARGNMGVVLNALGRHEEALPVFAALVEDRSRVHGPMSIEVVGALANYGGLLRTADRLEESLAALDEAVRRVDEILPPEHNRRGILRTFRARTLADLGRHAEAIEDLRLAERILVAALGEEHPRTRDATALRHTLEEAVEGAVGIEAPRTP